MKIFKRSVIAGIISICLSLQVSAENENLNAELKPDEITKYKQINDVSLSLHIFYPEGHKESDKSPAIVFFFGGGWIDGTPDQFYKQSKYLSSRGMVAICAEYRIKSKHNTTPQECVKDGKSAIRWVRNNSDVLGVDPNKIAAGGGSAGGQVAAATALVEGFDEKGEEFISCKPNALVLFNPVFDNGPDGYGYERVKEYWKAFSPMHNISSKAPPTVIFLGTEDVYIPVSTAEDYRKRMNEAGVRCDLHLYEGQEHSFFFKPEFYNKTLIKTDKFLESIGYLQGPPTLKD
jgi:acetyl esterase